MLDRKQDPAGNYDSAVSQFFAETMKGYPFDRTGKKAAERLSEYIYQNKDREYEEVKGLLIESGAIWKKIMKRLRWG